MASTQDDTIAELQRANASLRRDLAERDAAMARRDSDHAERIAHQAATVEVLKAMSASPGDPQPVYDLIAAQAVALCGGPAVGIFEFDGALIHCRVATFQGSPPDLSATYIAAFPRPADQEPNLALAIAIREARIVHIRDADIDGEISAAAVRAGFRSGIIVPLLRDGGAIGAMSLARTETGGYSDSQVELLKTFAEQAVIAITSAETYRALQTRTADLQESLEYQTATSEVLKSISQLSTDIQPVLDKLAEIAARLCDAEMTVINRRDARVAWVAASHGYPEPLCAYWRAVGPIPLDPDSPVVAMRTLIEGQIVHIHDVSAVPFYPTPNIELGGLRTIVGAPLRRSDEIVGMIGLARQRVEPFTERQIALLENFAAQAVIAIENTRLLTEQREALEQQTATADVLGVINANPGNLSPVFDAMLEKAMRLCGVAFGMLRGYDGERFHELAARGLPPAYTAFLAEQSGTMRPGSASAMGRALKFCVPVQQVDIREEEDYKNGALGMHAIVDLAGGRTILHVPLVKDQASIGFFTFFRQEVLAFTDKHITLLENFAAQAVIAMENARLLTEQREALEQQTATAEVLQVINTNPGDVTPVFDALLESAHRLCDAPLGALVLWDGEHMRAVATHGFPDWYAARLRQPYPASLASQSLIDGARLFHVPDTTSLAPDPRAQGVQATGARSGLMIPLRKDGVFLGYISSFRTEVRPFSDKEIGLLENFAAQAVIAMENARLLTEQREALEQQTATAEVLGVINASPGDLPPVFDAMLERALRLCGAAFGMFYTFDGAQFHIVAARGVPAAFEAYRRQHPMRATPDTPPGQAILTRRPVQVEDVMTHPFFAANPQLQDIQIRLGGIRAVLNLPLLKDGMPCGMFVIYRADPGAFSGRQIALLESFAAQAVIAMENARLLTEQREALEQQTAMAEVLEIINLNPGEVQPVFDAILERAHRICKVNVGAFGLYDGKLFRVLSAVGYPPATEARLRAGFAPVPVHEPLFRGERAYTPDRERRAWTPEDESALFTLREAGLNTIVLVPLFKDGTLLGFISAARREVAPFSDREIALLENFAAQAVIAMENARLLNELRESLAQQTAMADVLRVINLNPGDVQPVFDAVLGWAHRMCKADLGALGSYENGTFRVLSAFGYPPETEFMLRAGFETHEFHEPLLRGEHAYVSDREQLATPGSGVAGWLGPAAREFLVDYLRGAGINVHLMVPLYKDGALLGFISAARREAWPFSDKEIALLENFAAQSVIAMDNARLLNEIRQRQSELDITFENMGDGVAMFDREQKLAAWNRNFQDILDLPDDAVRVGLPFADYIRGLAEKGEYGPDADADEQVARLTALLDQTNRFERTRPNGHVIDIRQNPIPGGGFVIIYADISERKRAEEALRAARDAAEQALRDLKLAQANLVQAEKMASLGQLTAGIAHEIKNPLNFVNNFASLSVDLLAELKEAAAPGFAALTEDQRAEIDEVSDMLTGNLRTITEHGKRADGIVKAMLEHSRGASGERREVNINELADEALNLAYHGARAQDQSFNITLERAFGEGIAPIELNPQDITRVLLNLFGNGFYAANKRAGNGGGSPTLKLATRDLGRAVEIRVRDNGTGIPEDIRDKLFQPFFTTKPTGEGTGLGLSITWDIVTKQHGGTIAVASEVDAFTEFTVTLPRRMFEGTAP